MLTIYIDSDGCPVKDEVYHVAARYSLPVRVVANRYQKIPVSPRIEAVVVEQGTGKADDWIAGHAGAGDIVITSDIPLAARCLDNGARALGPKGREFTPDSIGGALATRLISDHLRQMGVMTGGPSGMTRKDRSRFLSSLDGIINAIRRENEAGT
ncbi:MAG: YaiI/YqxD family protein [Myxococcales bacterium]|nr:MAG: YaiI/YqxD family protein [Myxococcales bacterium]